MQRDENDPLAPFRAVWEPFNNMGKAIAAAWTVVERDILPNLPDWLRRKAEEDCRRLETRYRIKKNPLDAWEAYQTMRLTGGAIPEWVLSYFDEAADNLQLLETDVQRRRIEKAVGPAVAEAMGFKKPGRSGAGNAFRDHREDSWGWVDHAAKVYRLLEAGTHAQETYAVEAVAEEAGVSPSTVWRAWNLAKQHFPEDMQGVIRKSRTS